MLVSVALYWMAICLDENADIFQILRISLINITGIKVFCNYNRINHGELSYKIRSKCFMSVNICQNWWEDSSRALFWCNQTLYSNKTQYLRVRLFDSDFNVLISLSAIWLLSDCSLSVIWLLSECSNCSQIALWPRKMKINCSRQTCAGRTQKVTPRAPLGAKKTGYCWPSTTINHDKSPHYNIIKK